jgi:chitin disaccharide deacetylase
LRGLSRLALAVAVFSITPLPAQQPKPASRSTLAQRLGYPADSRLLIIHADDYGMMHSVNTAIQEAFEHHWISSASILVPGPWFPEVAQWAKTHPDADLGIHLARNAEWTSYRWSSVSPQPQGSRLLDADATFPSSLTKSSLTRKCPTLKRNAPQIDKAAAAGMHISHVDDHMGTIVSSKDLFNVYIATSRTYRLPALLSRDSNLYGLSLEPGTIVVDPGVPQSQWLDAYKKMLQPLPPGTYQPIVHLAHNDAEMQGATLDHADCGAQWRQNELDMVRRPEFQKFIAEQHFILISWRDLAKALPVSNP